MRPRARWAGTAVQLVLVVFSVALLAMSVLFDVVALVAQDARWASLALWDLEVGLGGNAAAGVLALASLRHAVPWSRAGWLASRRALAHLSALVPFGAALVLRQATRHGLAPNAAIVLSAAGLGLVAVAAWLTNEDAYRLP
jgi:uncharacterized membrane protein